MPSRSHPRVENNFVAEHLKSLAAIHNAVSEGDGERTITLLCDLFNSIISQQYFTDDSYLLFIDVDECA